MIELHRIVIIHSNHGHSSPPTRPRQQPAADRASRSATSRSTEQQLLEVQNELSTGKRINAPSDDPGDAAIAQQLQKTLEQRQAYSDNLTAGQRPARRGRFDAQRSHRPAPAGADDRIGQRRLGCHRRPAPGAAAVVQSLYNQALSLGNKQFEGIYLFGGDSSTDRAVRRRRRRREVRRIDQPSCKISTTRTPRSRSGRWRATSSARSRRACRDRSISRRL